ncbi:MAG: response regulator [Chloroflexota bacterium]|nr:response regulator [Chloroflexota bacterium]
MADFAGWNVLIVDDEPDNVGVLELVFRFHKATVFMAESGKECLERMKTVVPALILMDIQMPEMSGYQLLAVIRSEPRWQHIPIIAVTAHVMSSDQERILAAGFDGYIPKPVSTLTIAKEVSDILQAVRS